MTGKLYSLIVTDTSPLITLALADSLNVLLRLGQPVYIPDVVYNEATRLRDAPGAKNIIEWIGSHIDRVHIFPTDIGIDQQWRLEAGRPARGMGETAAIETLDRYLRQNPDSEALLIFEDVDISKRQAILDKRVGIITTGDFLRELERAGLIQSTDYILDAAQKAGRNVDRQRATAGKNPVTARLREQLSNRKT